MPAARFISDIVDRHWEDSAILWLTRANAVDGPNALLRDLARLDERVEANLDGLRDARTKGWAPPPEAWRGAGAGEFFAAGILAMESGDPALLARLMERAAAQQPNEPYHAADDHWRGLVSALAWTDRGSPGSTIEHLLRLEHPRARWLGLAVCGARRMGRQPGLGEALLTDPSPQVRARALRMFGELGRADMRAPVNAMLADPDDDCRFWAAWTAVCLGTDEGLRNLAAFTGVAGPRCDRALDLLLRRLPVDRANDFLRQLAANPGQRRTVVHATAAIGDPLYVPWLIEQLNDPTMARLAGDAILTLTGAEADKLAGAKPASLQSGPTDDPADDDVSLDDDAGLPWLSMQRCAAWWESNKSRFHIGTAYMLGVPKQATNWIAILTNQPQRHRRTAALELALQRPGRAMFEVRARADLQRRLIGRAGTPV